MHHAIVLHGRCMAGGAGALRYACALHVPVVLGHRAVPQSTVFGEASAGMTALFTVPLP